MLFLGANTIYYHIIKYDTPNVRERRNGKYFPKILICEHFKSFLPVSPPYISNIMSRIKIKCVTYNGVKIKIKLKIKYLYEGILSYLLKFYTK